MKKIRIDLFKLCDENDRGQSRIRAVLNPKLKKLLKSLVKEIQQKTSFKIKDIEDFIGIKYHGELYSYLKKWDIPLIYIYKIIKLGRIHNIKQIEKKKIEIIDSIEKFSSGAGKNYKKMKCPKFLTNNLCKIAGAIVADGHLQKGKVKGGTEFTIILKDGYLDNVELFCKWIENEFGLKVKIVHIKKDRCWYTKFGSKIIFRYLNKIFEIPSGKKHNIVKMPKIIKSSSLEYQINFCKAVGMFDGGLDFLSGYFEFKTNSKKLIEDFEDVLLKCGINIDYKQMYFREKYKTKGHVFKISKKDKLRKFHQLFCEKNTTKWNQLNYHLYGFDECKDIEEVIGKLERAYPKRGVNPTTFSNIVKIVDKFQPVTFKKVKKEINKSPSVTYAFLGKLTNWKILTTKQIPMGHGWFYKVWSINLKLKNKGG